MIKENDHLNSSIESYNLKLGYYSQLCRNKIHLFSSIKFFFPTVFNCSIIRTFLLFYRTLQLCAKIIKVFSFVFLHYWSWYTFANFTEMIPQWPRWLKQNNCSKERKKIKREGKNDDNEEKIIERNKERKLFYTYYLCWK